MIKQQTLPPVLASQAGLRLDKFLAQAGALSRTRVRSLLDNGLVSPIQAADSKVKEGQIFTLTLPPLADALPTAENIPLDILFEDDDIIVINKPAGMVVHPAAGNHSGTLVNALLAHCQSSLSGINGIKRPGIVHRIDKNTSGVLVVAKNDTAHQGLATQFARHSIGRVYQAIVYGVPAYTGKITGNIGRSTLNRQKMALVGEGCGKKAVTHYRVIRPLFGNKASLIECRLETGRTHQIRVHMTSIKHPLVGDDTYGHAPKGTPDILRLFPRQALHAQMLTIVHPRTGRTLTFNAPMPPDMALLLKADSVW